MYQYDNDNDNDNNFEKLKGMSNLQQDNTLSELFFSKVNMKRIQNKIRKEVLIRTNNQFKLDIDQDEADLLLAMRAVYFDKGVFKPNKIIHQIKQLNNQVIEYILPDIISNIKQEYGYLKEISQPLKPLPRPINVNNAKNVLPSMTTLWQI